jgi:hypothetical protein
MAKIRIAGLAVDYSEDGWDEFKKWLDGTYARLFYVWVDEGEAYSIAAPDGSICRTFSINKADAAEFEANYKTAAPRPINPTPIEDDGKPVYVMSPSTEGLYTWLTSHGDDLNPTPPSYGRGEGAKIYLSWDGTEEFPSAKEVELEWMEPIELHDGHMNFDPTKWGFADEWCFFVRLPANTVVENGGGTGNCNVVMVQQLTPWDSGTSYNPGDLVTHDWINYVCVSAHSNQEPPNATYWAMTLNVIMPAISDDGDFDIDLETAVPSPCGKKEDGYWDVPDKWTEVITPNAGAVKGTWNLFDFQNDMYFMKNLDCGDPRGVWDLDAYKSEWISSRWKLVFKVTRVTEGAAEIGGDLMCFRPGAL